MHGLPGELILEKKKRKKRNMLKVVFCFLFLKQKFKTVTKGKINGILSCIKEKTQVNELKERICKTKQNEQTTTKKPF